MINGVEWTARSKNGDIIEPGTEVVIDEISGVKAIVEKAAASGAVTNGADMP